MADLSELNSSQAVKIAGADTAGNETAFVPSPTAAPVPNVPGLVVRSLPHWPKTFIVRAPDVAIALNKSMISLLNSGGSAVKIRIHEIRIINTRVAATTGVVADFQLNRITAHTPGTVLTPRAFDSSDSLNGSVLAATNGTATESAGPITLKRAQWSSDEWGAGALDVEGSDHAQQVTGEPFYRPAPNTKPITLNAGEGVHIKQITNSANGTFDLEIIFTEEVA